MCTHTIARTVPWGHLWLRRDGAGEHQDDQSREDPLHSWSVGTCALLHLHSKADNVSLVWPAQVYATEQNPKALGVTVPELGFSSLPAELNPLGGAKPKTLFSMLIPEVKESIEQKGVKSVVIFGIEVQANIECLVVCAK